MYSVFCSAAFGHLQAASQMHLSVPWLCRLCYPEPSLAVASRCCSLLALWAPQLGGVSCDQHSLRQLQCEDSAVKPPGPLERRLQSCAAWASLLWGVWVFPDQGSNPYLLHWQADSLGLCHQGSCFLSFWAKRTVPSAFYSLPGEWNFSIKSIL